MIAWLISLGVSPRFAKPLLYVLAAFALGVALFGLKSCYDRGVIKSHDADQRARTAEADRKADAHAAETRLADQERANTENAEIMEAVNEAGPNAEDRRAAYYRCVGLQQAARAERKPPPNC